MSGYKVVISGNTLHTPDYCELKVLPETVNDHLVYLTDPFTIYTACATYGPLLSITGISHPCQISAGPLSLTTGTLGNYAIDWKLNTTVGTTEFSSGYGGSDFEVVHPFSGFPVNGGTIYAVFRYIYINSVLYSPHYAYVAASGASYSPDLLTCLGSVTVYQFNCSNGENADTGLTMYSHKVEYNYTTGAGLQGVRTINMELNSDGSTRHVAWKFYAKQPGSGYYPIYDTLKISYVNRYTGVVTELSNWRVGYNPPNSTNYTSTPKDWTDASNYGLRSVSNLTGISYGGGDWLRYEITPNPTTSNTEWNLYLKCLTGDTTTNCYTFPTNWNQINPNSTGIYTYSNCYYSFSASTKAAHSANFAASNLFKYINIATGTYGDSFTIYVGSIRTGYTYTSSGGTSIYSTASLNGSANLVKSGSVVTLTFTDNTDYLYYKNGYTNISNSSVMSDYTPNNWQTTYFKYYTLYMANGYYPGDVYTGITFYFHPSASITFDDTNHIISITAVNITNGLTDPGGYCNEYHTNGDTTVSVCANGVSLANFNYTTYVKYSNNTNFYGSAYYATPTYYSLTQSTLTNYAFYYVHPTILQNFCNLANCGWWFHTGGTSYTELSSYSGFWIAYRDRTQVIINDLSNPASNYEVWEGVDGTTGQPKPYVKIYP